MRAPASARCFATTRLWTRTRGTAAAHAHNSPGSICVHHIPGFLGQHCALPHPPLPRLNLRSPLRGHTCDAIGTANQHRQTIHHLKRGACEPERSPIIAPPRCHAFRTRTIGGVKAKTCTVVSHRASKGRHYHYASLRPAASLSRTMPGRPSSSHCFGSTGVRFCSTCKRPAHASLAATRLVRSICCRHASPGNRARGTSEGQHVLSWPRTSTSSSMCSSMRSSTRASSTSSVSKSDDERSEGAASARERLGMSVASRPGAREHFSGVASEDDGAADASVGGSRY